jgi:PST family polysaccharide transporter
MSYVSMLTVPLGLGMALVAGPLIRTVFPDRWVEAIPVTRAIAIYALCLSLTYNIGDVYKAQGRPSVLTRLSLVNLVVLLPALWWAVAIAGDITVVAWTQTIVSLGYMALNFFVASRMLDVPVRKIIEALLPALMAGMMMAVTVSSALLVLSQGPSLLQLIGSVITGALTYTASLWWLQQDLVLQASHTLRAALVRR